MAYTKEELVRIGFTKSFGLAGTIVASRDTQEMNLQEIASEVLSLAHLLNDALDEGLDTLGVKEAGGVAPKSSGQVSSRTYSTQGESTGSPCPDCAAHGRSGVAVSGVTQKGKSYTACSLRERQKVGNRYVDVGDCAWIDWS